MSTAVCASGALRAAGHRLASSSTAAATAASSASSASFARLASIATPIASSSPPRWCRRALHVPSRAMAAPMPSRPTRLPSSGQSEVVPELVGQSPEPMPEAAAVAAAASPEQQQQQPIDWSSSFHGLSATPFDRDVAAVLLAPIDPDDIEIKPDGILYLPEIKYRRILNTAFGPGGWGLAPRGELAVGDKVVTREYALVVQGRFVGQARGECAFFNGPDGVATAGEGCKSNALMRCCKDLGIASELWDPRFIRAFKKQHCREAWVEHVATKKRRQIWLRKDCPPAYPYAATTGYTAKPAAAAR